MRRSLKYKNTTEDDTDEDETFETSIKVKHNNIIFTLILLRKA